MPLAAQTINEAISELTLDRGAYDAAVVESGEKHAALSAAQAAAESAEQEVAATEAELRSDVEAVQALIALTFLPPSA